MNETFTITKDHLKLLGASYWNWNYCETGAPEMDPKRPYGNSDVAGDVRTILGGHTDSNAIKCPECGSAMLDVERCACCGYVDVDKFRDDSPLGIHKQMRRVISIVCRVVSSGELVKPGKYRCTGYQKWEYVG